MPRLVTKFGYLKQGKRKSPGGYARYIATQEGVEKLTDGPQKTYADYIATRPRAERLGSHGLFTDEGNPVILSRVSKELNEYKGNIYTAILSLRREDAERLGFDSALRWRDFLRGQTQTIAENLKIPLNHLRWYAAFHNEGYHPHVHMIAYSTVPGEGYLTEKGVEKIRTVFANEIFQQDLLCTYQKQTEYRDQLRSQGRESVAEIVEQINSGHYENPQLGRLMVRLADKLSRTTGKKVYGYLKPEVKAIVNEIVAELAKDSRIKRLYDLWYEQREDVLRTYSDHFPERIPLEQNPEFKTIRNAVIQEAMHITAQLQQTANMEPRQDLEEVGLPMGLEPPTDAIEDPAYWKERFSPVIPPTVLTMEEATPINESRSYGSDSRQWWSDAYKQARAFLYGTKESKPDFEKAMELLQIEANHGNGFACYDLGRMHLAGLGCEENEEAAQSWFQKAYQSFTSAEKTASKPAYLRYRIGKCHAYGHGTEQSYEESARWFQMAVEDNNPFAAYALGGQYLRGQGVERSDETAYSLFYMAATHEKQPNVYAQYQLGRMCRDGIGTERNESESSRWFTQAYKGFLEMGKTMADDKLYYRLGAMNLTGTGTDVNLAQAKYYLEKAAELGNLDAVYGLGKLYLDLAFSEYDPAKAVTYLEKAVEGDHAFAKYQLGKMLCQGKQIEKDISRGLPLLEKLAKEGVSFAAYIVGKVYLTEEGWKDVKKAIQYLTQAAEDGNSYGTYQLGKLYYFGNGVRRDAEKGLEYLKASAAQGNQYAATLLQTIQQHTWGAAMCASSLLAQLGRLLQEKEQKQSPRPGLDRKLRQEIAEKSRLLDCGTEKQISCRQGGGIPTRWNRPPVMVTPA